jgi:type IV pilus assembly protein PilB
MILVTGPTGSGKTVTLYSALQQLNHSSRNILTVEDPVEIKLPGVNQISVNSRIGLDFPETLRAFLRQDPDVMMVGEIRDRETAEIAIKAAQTGHLVLSTLHTNDAPGAITRLVNMGIPRWNIAASVILVSAQRLVRRLCPHCRRPARIPPDGRFFEAAGCPRCLNGYRGRLGIHEVMPMTDAITTRILQNDRDTTLADDLRATGLRRLRDAGLAKAAEGLTSLGEIDRVTRG